MDDRRFDQITRSIASATNRRDFMRRILGVAAASAGVMALSSRETDAARRGFSGPKLPTQQPDPCNPAGSSCALNDQCCTNFCLQHLGGGTCDICDATICGESSCVDLLWDPFNCGSCNNVCGAGRTCNQGTCQISGV